MTGFWAVLEALEDQIASLELLRRIRMPWSVTIKAPELSLSGVSLLATQTTVPADIFWYHIPKYRPFEIPGLKNPSSKLPSAETKRSPSRMD
jgi:hypothetical protein